MELEGGAEDAGYAGDGADEVEDEEAELRALGNAKGLEGEDGDEEEG